MLNYILMSDTPKIEQKALQCPVCKSDKAMIVGENVKLGGKFEDKEFLTTELTVLRCTKCRYYMLCLLYTSPSPRD